MTRGGTFEEGAKEAVVFEGFLEGVALFDGGLRGGGPGLGAAEGFGVGFEFGKLGMGRGFGSEEFGDEPGGSCFIGGGPS